MATAWSGTLSDPGAPLSLGRKEANLKEPLTPVITDRFTAAVDYAAQVHGDQRRKGGNIPYLSHLLSVAALVLEDGGDEDQAVGALLHDAAEDQGGEERLRDIERRFGDRVAKIVLGCSDTLEQPKPPWRERKDAYIRRIRNERDPDVLRVSLADKLHNARAILADYRVLGDRLFDRFTTGSKDDMLWYLREMTNALSSFDSPMAPELDRVVTELHRLCGVNRSVRPGSGTPRLA